MILTARQALAILADIGTAAQQSGLGPGEPEVVAMRVLIEALQGVLAQAGHLHPGSVLAIDALGERPPA